MIKKNNPISVRVDDSILEHISVHPDYRSLGDWINKNYWNIESPVEILIERKNKLQQELDLLEKQISTMQSPDYKFVLEPHQEKFLLDVILPRMKQIEAGANYSPHSVFKLFKNRYSLNISMKQFRLIIQQYFDVNNLK